MEILQPLNANNVILLVHNVLVLYLHNALNVMMVSFYMDLHVKILVLINFIKEFLTKPVKLVKIHVKIAIIHKQTVLHVYLVVIYKLMTVYIHVVLNIFLTVAINVNLVHFLAIIALNHSINAHHANLVISFIIICANLHALINILDH